MTDGRTHLSRVLKTLFITAVGGSVLAAPAAHAAPGIDTVQHRVERLDQQAAHADQAYDRAYQAVVRTRARVGSLHADLHHEHAKAVGVRNGAAVSAARLAVAAARQSTGADPDALVTQLSKAAALSRHRRHVSAKVKVSTRRISSRHHAAQRQLQKALRTEHRLGADKARAEAAASRAKQLLGTLQERARAARASRSAERTANRTAVAASGRAAAAVSYAMAQVGKSYVYGAAGPSAFDCSGLTMRAWAQAGVSLPHSSSAQMGSGTRVSQSQLQPGDLVFYYSPVSHVGIYIGNGRIVNALNPGAGVRISAVNSMPYAGAVRPG